LASRVAEKSQHALGRLGIGEYKNQPDVEDMVEQMRQNIEIEVIQRHGDNSPGVTAFKVAYVASTPQLAQSVTTELTSLFIEENLKAREQMAENTSQFIDTEVDSARKDLAAQAGRLREFKSHFMGELPEQQQANLQLLGQLHAQLQANSDALNRAHDQEVYLRNLISERETAISNAETQPKVNETEVQLTKSRALLQELESRYTDRHPDVVKMKAEVARLEE